MSDIVVMSKVMLVVQAVHRSESVPLAEHLGLAVLGSGEFHFVAPQTKLYKVSHGEGN